MIMPTTTTTTVTAASQAKDEECRHTSSANDTAAAVVIATITTATGNKVHHHRQQDDNANDNDGDNDDEHNADIDDNDDEYEGFLSKQRVGRRHHDIDDDYDDMYEQRQRQRRQSDWMRPYWLGVGLFLVLFSFWLLDSLKDPVLGILVGGNLERHQPTAKLFSVCTTLALVCFLEYVAHEQQQQQSRQQQSQRRRTDEDVLDGGGHWSRMDLDTQVAMPRDERILREEEEERDRVPSSIFASIGVPYSILFGLMAYILQFNASVALLTNNDNTAAAAGMDGGSDAWTTGTTGAGTILSSHDEAQQQRGQKHNHHAAFWHAVGYVLYAAIESFGSVSVATFWSYTNSTLSLQDAERYYGLILATAQLGAIGGSTMVTARVWSNITLIILACLIILLHVCVMTVYGKRFRPTTTTNTSQPVAIEASSSSGASMTTKRARKTSRHGEDKEEEEEEPTLWSGVYLILKHNYVLLILGVSCLYEVSLTILNYQMTLLGWSRFEETVLLQTTTTTGTTTTTTRTGSTTMNFTQFMGHFGQMVNVTSLVMSYYLFPWLIRRLGLRRTLRLFPTLLLIANIVAFGALPGNLAVLFVCMSLLKAMTYSIHDPSKEILYIPTSNPIKFKAKFWIDVVGARIAKAAGSGINTITGSVDRSIRMASAPSILTALGLWWACYRVGTRFDKLVSAGEIVGVNDSSSDDHNENRCSSRRRPRGGDERLGRYAEVSTVGGALLSSSDNNSSILVSNPATAPESSSAEEFPAFATRATKSCTDLPGVQ